MNLKQLFISDPWEDPAVHINCSGLPGDRACEQYFHLAVLKRSLIIDTVEDSTLHIHCPGLPED